MTRPVTRSGTTPGSTSRDLALVAVFAGVVAALGIVPAFTPPGFVVPITAQTLGVMLAGSILGARRGGLSMVLFLALVAAGLPLLAGGRGGLSVFVGASVGFLLCFPLAAVVIGWLSARAGPPYSLAWGVASNVVGGILVVYAGGILGMAVVLDVSIETAFVANWVYLPGDAAKVVVAAFVARGVHAAYPGLLGGSRSAEPAEPQDVASV
ncbi:MAG: biotin transporter BioY [Nocardioidaceae bacterium]|nr:biotin transporter BioY [Nocardioidaceae bacterium]